MVKHNTDNIVVRCSNHLKGYIDKFVCKFNIYIHMYYYVIIQGYIDYRSYIKIIF